MEMVENVFYDENGYTRTRPFRLTRLASTNYFQAGSDHLQEIVCRPH